MISTGFDVIYLPMMSLFIPSPFYHRIKKINELLKDVRQVSSDLFYIKWMMGVNQRKNRIRLELICTNHNICFDRFRHLTIKPKSMVVPSLRDGRLNILQLP